MALSTATYFATPAQFGAWLQAHGTHETELVVGFWKIGSGRTSMSWSESVDEACPPSYRKPVPHRIVTAKKAETRARRLLQLIAAYARSCCSSRSVTPTSVSYLCINVYIWAYEQRCCHPADQG